MMSIDLCFIFASNSFRLEQIWSCQYRFQE